MSAIDRLTDGLPVGRQGRLDLARKKIARALEDIRIYGTRAVNLDFDSEDNFVDYTYERLKGAERSLEEALEALE